MCLECVTFLNTCVEFTKRSKQIQVMFDELTSSKNDQISSIRLRYELPSVTANNSFSNVQIIIKSEESYKTEDIMITQEIDEHYLIEEHLDDDEDEPLDIKESKKMSKDEIEKFYTYQCHLCDEEFSNMQQLTDHCRNLHDTSSQVECLCGKKLDTWKKLMDHRKDHSNERNKFQCFDCKLNYKTYQAYEKHLARKHGENSIKFICSICGRSFKEKQVLRNHERIHLPDDLKLKFPCLHCKKKFVNNHCLKVHVARIHEKVAYFFCEVCGKGCTTKSDLIWHMDKHVQDRNFPCEICNLKFKSTNSLRIHKRRHEAIELTKQCQICMKEFRSNAALSNHKLVHTDEKKYKCQQCPNSFKRLETYKCHLSTHTGVR